MRVSNENGASPAHKLSTILKYIITLVNYGPRMEAKEPCLICGSIEWAPLSEFKTEFAITTDGLFVANNFQKFHCKHCGLVTRYPLASDDSLQSFYQDDYDLYNRPAPANYDLGLYKSYAAWIATALTEIQPDSCLEIGCGRGELMSLLQEYWPNCDFYGVEPNLAPGTTTFSPNLDIINAMVGVDTIELPKAKLIFSLNVIEHVPDPISFLSHLRSMITEDGRVLILCPDGGIAHNDMLFADHLWTFTAAHIKALCKMAGLEVTNSWHTTTEVPGETVQMHLAEKSQIASPSSLMSDLTSRSERLFAERTQYFSAWETLDDILLAKLSPFSRVACFGARTWAHLVQLYAPNAWKKVSNYVVDGVSETIEKGLPVHPFASFNKEQAEALLLGVKPSSQTSLKKRLTREQWEVLDWYETIPS